MANLVITASANSAYGSVEINNKYAPLTGVVLTNNDLDGALKIINTRLKALSDVGAFPKKLNLYLTLPAINVNIPPVVVISSNRAEWIAAQFDAETPGYNATGYLDALTLNKGLYLWYSPRRSGRRVFILVHSTEYGYYVDKLGQVPDVTIVGWKVTVAGKALDVAGFGASRLAAIELVKHLGFHKAWVVDDNVVNINGFPNLLADMEANMSNNIWAIGFGAASLLKQPGDLTGETRFSAGTYTFGSAEPGLLQQAVLWNVDQLRTTDRTMSPCFVTSNEDVSFCNWMIKAKKDQRVITALKIVKVKADPDTSNPGAAEVAKRKTRMLALFADYEGELKVSRDNTQMPLSQFVSDVVLRTPTAEGQKANVAQSQCVEQIMAAALLKWAAPGGLLDPYSGVANANDRVAQLTPAQL